jgi:predicted phosphodiesterase
MRIAALYDIHGNLPALEAVLEEVRRLEVDLVVVGGDVVPGPMPCEVLDRLLTLDLPKKFIRGNGELAVLDHVAGRPLRPMPDEAARAIAWTAEQLGPEHLRAIGDWPRTVQVAVAGMGEVLFCHATPRDEHECFTKRTPEHQLVPMFAGLTASTVVCGHTHMQFDRRIGGVRVVNAGSVGMPIGEAGADWLLVDGEVKLQHTQYDPASAAERVRRTEYPQAKTFAQRSVLEPPSEQEMLAAFASADARRANAKNVRHTPPN